MGIQKIGAFGQTFTNPPMAVALAPGERFLLPAGQGVLGTFAQGPSGANGWTGNTLTGEYMLDVGPFTDLQVYNSVLQVWESYAPFSGEACTVSSDGNNFSLANTTGCPVGAVITNAGSGLTNGFNTVTVTPSSGGSTWNTIVGGAINTTVTITAGGSGYTKAPILVFNPPANQGSIPYILPTAICTISSGAINAVTVTNQGAGLVSAPTITVIPAIGDTTGAGGVLTVNATLAGSGTLLWMGMATPGTGLTSVPTFTFSPASSIAATAIMNFTVTGLTVTAAGVAYPSNGVFGFVVTGSQVAGTAANTNPAYDKNWIGVRLANVTVTNSGTTFSGTTVVVNDPGYGYERVPDVIYPSYVGATTQAQLTPTVGGQNDFSYLQPI